MRIVYLLGSIGYSGGSLVLYNFMENLVKRGHEVYVVTPDLCIKWKEDTKEEIIQKRKSTNSPNFFDSVYIKSGFKDLKNKITTTDLWWYHHFLPKFIKKVIENFDKNINSCDILVATLWLTCLPAYLLSDKAKNIFFHMQHYEELFSIDSEFKRKLTRMSYFLPFNLIANSTWLKNIVSKICNRNSELITPGIDFKMFKPSILPSEKYRPKSKYNILSFVDRNREFKGAKELYETIKIVKKELGKDKVNFKLYGFSLPKYFSDLGVEFLGYVSPYRLPELYSSGDIFLFASWYESFPLPPIEAMSCGCFVVTTKFGTEDYAIGNWNSFVVLPRNPNQLAEKTLIAVENPKSLISMVENALETVKKFNWKTQTDKLEKYFIEAKVPSISSKLTILVENLINGENIEETEDIIFGEH